MMFPEKEELPAEFRPDVDAARNNRGTHRKRAYVSYQIGHQSDDPSDVKAPFRSTHGPYPLASLALAISPTCTMPNCTEGFFIQRANVDGTDELIYKWMGDRWMRLTTE